MDIGAFISRKKAQFGAMQERHRENVLNKEEKRAQKMEKDAAYAKEIGDSLRRQDKARAEISRTDKLRQKAKPAFGDMGLDNIMGGSSSMGFGSMLGSRKKGRKHRGLF